MKAVAVNPTARTVQLVQQEPPRVTRNRDVRIRMLDVGICGTDREICSFEYGTPPRGSAHLVLGHESLGQVMETGPGVTGLAEGDLVVPMVRRACPHDHCRACRSGRQDFCYTGDFVERGIKEAHGFMTEQVVDDAAFMVPIPRSLRPVAVLVEPLTIAEKALMQVAQVQQRLPWACPHAREKGEGHCRTAVVLGAGPVGLLGAMALANRGYDTWVYSREKAPNLKASIVEAIGGHYVSAEESTIADFARRVGPIDLVYEAVGASRTAFEMLSVLGTNGIFIFTGVPGRRGPVELDTDALMRNLVLRNQIVFGTVNAGRATFEAAVSDLASFALRWPDAVQQMITGRFPIEAHSELLLGSAMGIKNVLAIGRES